MRKLFTLITVLLVLTSLGFRTDKYEFTNKMENSIIQLIAYSSDGLYRFEKVSKLKSALTFETILIKETELEHFSDSLIQVGYMNEIEQIKTRKPKCSALLDKYEFSIVNPAMDSVYVFNLDFRIQTQSGDTFKLKSQEFNTLSSKNEIRNKIKEFDIIESCILFGETDIRRLSANIELISTKPPLYVTDSTAIDYNYSCFIYY